MLAGIDAAIEDQVERCGTGRAEREVTLDATAAKGKQERAAAPGTPFQLAARVGINIMQQIVRTAGKGARYTGIVDGCAARDIETKPQGAVQGSAACDRKTGGGM